MGSKIDQILDIAQTLTQRGGYNGFSFREIASHVGIKSASVHYHFPTKEDLGVAMVERYTQDFLAALGDSKDPDATPDELLSRYLAVYRKAMLSEGGMCLCSVLGTEIPLLPEPVGQAVRKFFNANSSWMTHLIVRANNAPKPATKHRHQAARIIALLQGAMIMSRTYADPDLFDKITRTIELKVT